jgi:CheY-like chemotaxis protein
MSQLHRILYVEDEPDIQAVAKLALEMVGGFTVRICSSGQQALREAADFAPDMILLDVMMPGLDGPTTLKSMREQEPLRDVPVAFMTAKVQPGEVSHYKSLGALDVIAKPFDPMTLSGRITEIWNSRNG